MYVIQKWLPELGVWVVVPASNGLVYEYDSTVHAYKSARVMGLHTEVMLREGEAMPDKTLGVWWRVQQVSQ